MTYYVLNYMIAALCWALLLYMTRGQLSRSKGYRFRHYMVSWGLTWPLSLPLAAGCMVYGALKR